MENNNQKKVNSQNSANNSTGANHPKAVNNQQSAPNRAPAGKSNSEGRAVPSQSRANSSAGRNDGMHESNLRNTGVKQTSVNDSIPLPPPKKKKKMKVGVKVLLGFLIALGVVILSVGIYIFSILNFYKPTVDSDLPDFLQGLDKNGIGGNIDKNDPQQSQTMIDDQQFNFLVVARDKVSGLTDVMMLINYNITDQSLNVMQIPRDTYIEIDDYYYHKINGAYSYYLSQRRGESDADRSALRDVADLLEDNLCVKIHYTAQMDIDGFSDIVDAIGGVEMHVPQRMYYSDPDQGLYINLYEGQQTLDGEKAEMFVRYRYGYANGDIGRGNAQKEFMTAFIKKVLSSISITDVNVITDLATTVYDCISTDLSLNDLIFFGKNFIGFGGKEKVDLSNVQMYTLPGNAFYYELSYYSLNKEVTADIINKYYNIYSVDITANFDRNSVFVNESSSDSKRIYNLPKEELDAEIYNAEDIDKDGVN